MKILKRLLNPPTLQVPARPSEPPEDLAPSQLGEAPDSRLAEIGSQAHTRRELLRVLARDTMRQCGVPDGWVECQVLVVNTRHGDTHMHARLVVRHWDDLLVRHVVAFERRLLAAVERFEPDAADWLRSITWQFSADNCPYTEPPPPETWRESRVEEATEPAVEEKIPPQPVDELEEDLATLLALRDRALAELRGDAPPVRDFAPTQPGLS